MNRLEEITERATQHQAITDIPFAATMVSSPMPMVITDPRQADNPIVFANDAFLKLTGYDRHEILGRNCRFLQGPGTNHDDVERVRRAIVDRRSIEVELLNYRKDGSLFWNRLLVSPVFEHGELTHYFASQYELARDQTSQSIADHDNLQLALQQRVADLTASEDRLQFTLKAGGLGTWTLDIPAGRLVSSAICKANFGRQPAETFTYQELQASIHPDDRARWQDTVAAALGSDGNFHIEYRIAKPDGGLGWIEVRAETEFDADGQPISMSGVSIDITERKEIEAHRVMMAQEMSHRMKNMLATVQSIVNQSMRASEPLENIRQNISDRIEALARSHDVLQGRSFDTADLGAVVEKATAPFNAAGRIISGGPNVSLSHQASSILALALHELATNAVKYGALSGDVGTVQITWHLDGEDFSFIWKELDGPIVVEPQRLGFGTRLIKMLGGGLKGSASLDYHPEGLVFTATTAATSLCADITS